MKIAVISDVHGNIEFLQEFINYIDKEKINIVLNLGDIIGGDYPLETFRIIMKDKRFISVRGNHDSSLFFNKEMTKEECQWIDELPLSRVVCLEDKKFLMVHSRINSNLDVPLLYKDKTLTDFFDDYYGDYDYILFGHTHQQCILSNYKGKTIINPGSLGLSYDEKLNFCIIVIDNKNIDIIMKKNKVIVNINEKYKEI